MKSTTDDLLTRFLLGELSDEERQVVEQRFLTDDLFFEEVLAAESALVDQYLLGALTETERERAKSLFETSRFQRQTLKSSKELLDLVRPASSKSLSSPGQPDVKIGGAAESRPTETGGNRYQSHESAHAISTIPLEARASARRLTWFVACTVGLACVSVMVLVAYFYSQKKVWDSTRRSLEHDRVAALEQLRVETQRREQIARQLEIEIQKRISTEESLAESKQTLRIRTTSLLLIPVALERANAANVVTVKTGASRFQIQLELDPNWHFSRYEVAIANYDEVRISSYSLDSSHIRQDKLELFVPGFLLKPQDYKLTLRGLSDKGDSTHLADYVFKVRK